ncbi:hypothetical protein LRP50_14945 [Enterovibrio sp. ZSDZ42]|uniref:Uncharacterized protein n=1 Tax=Enterovibrio gelatinilyticus TaxID=2899819 RepID=A0ABT5R338_9GAMM|nr:hypothetical protein [Enterovibrio sp. ZSDZ42]MDD1794429.1 hypothetical protein [Enterovibrio sp. ZSDZ42]
MIVQEESRKENLLSAGVTSQFIDAIDRLEELGEIQYQIQKPESAYWYLPSIENEYEILRGFDITPICDGSNGDSFYVLLSKPDERKFVYFELEADEIYNDFGGSFQLLLAHIIIDLMDFSEEQSIEDITKFADGLGLLKAKEVINTVSALDEDTDIEKWEVNVLPAIIGGTLNK